MAEGSGKWLLAVALLAACVSGVAAASSSPGQAPGIGRSWICRQDTGNGGSELHRQLVGEGCSLTHLSYSILLREKSFSMLLFLENTNLELPSALSNQSAVQIHVDLRPSASMNYYLVIDLPLHARYPPLDASGYATVEFGSPDLLLRDRKKEISDSCFWVLKDLNAAHLEKVAWRSYLPYFIDVKTEMEDKLEYFVHIKICSATTLSYLSRVHLDQKQQYYIFLEAAKQSFSVYINPKAVPSLMSVRQHATPVSGSIGLCHEPTKHGIEL
ncbi:hypothetical protein GUJ93_ZPchr0012g20060 [Zizania palustris]|uniref:Uncharacterized protein n=1 Tax=Zizania palustris TaxID=103762 RepID=A0A8J5WPZ5_ZIZPA|nr:hypothetical protein GUJ93_ZPchr0012g20060 [Zizania palustris]